MDLAIILAIVVIAIVVNSLIKDNRIKIKKNAQKDVIKQTSTEYIPTFQKREYFFRSVKEREFYHILQKALSDSPYHIFAQVRLADLIKTDPKFPYNRKMYMKTLPYQIDFLICKGDMYEIILAIELDSPHHHNVTQQKRDLFKSQVLDDAKIPLLRFRVEENLTPVMLKARLENYLSFPSPLE